MRSEDILQDIIALKYIKAVTFSGGEPLDQAEALLPLMRKLRERGYNICIYTGYTFEEAKADAVKFAAVSLADILVDGRFVLAKRTLSKPFIGSLNQRIIDIPKTLRQGEIIPFEPRSVTIKIA
jgi:anaerobic ribonucleoside-triphosphate reductase activating protein